MAYTIELAGQTFFGGEDTSGKYWLADGLSGWFDGAENRVKVDAIPGQHGGFQPSSVLANPRAIEFQGAYVASSAAVAEAWTRDWVAGLSFRNGFDLTVTDLNGPLTSKVWVQGKPLVKRISDRACRFSLPLIAPDPIRYGAARTLVKPAAYIVSDGLTYPLTYPLSYGTMSAATLSGYIQLENAGTAPVYPTWRVAGPIATGFTITSDGYTITFNRALAAGEVVSFGPTAGGRAILQDGSDVSVYLTQAQWVQVPAGGQRGFVFSPLGSAVGGSYCEATIKDGWF